MSVIQVMTDRDVERCWNGDDGGDNDKGVDDVMTR